MCQRHIRRRVQAVRVAEAAAPEEAAEAEEDVPIREEAGDSKAKEQMIYFEPHIMINEKGMDWLHGETMGKE